MRRTAAVLVFGAAAVSSCVDGGTASEVTSETIEITGPWRGVDADRFAEVLRAFEDKSGYDVQYVGSANFVDDLEDRIGEGNDPADIAVVPQPGLIRELATGGHIVPLESEVRDAVIENFGVDSAAHGTFDDVMYTIPFRITVKSLVWFQPVTILPA